MSGPSGKFGHSRHGEVTILAQDAGHGTPYEPNGDTDSPRSYARDARACRAPVGQRRSRASRRAGRRNRERPTPEGHLRRGNGGRFGYRKPVVPRAAERGHHPTFDSARGALSVWRMPAKERPEGRRSGDLSHPDRTVPGRTGLGRPCPAATDGTRRHARRDQGEQGAHPGTTCSPPSPTN